MKNLMVVVGLLAMLCIVPAVQAEDWADSMGNILSCKENAYFRGEAVKEIVLEKEFLGVDAVQLGIYTKIEVSNPKEHQRYYEGGSIARLIF